MGIRLHLVQLLLPLYDNDGRRFGHDEFARVRSELTRTFGGVTAYQQSPAQGLWEETNGKVRRDDVIVMEVMTEDLDRAWWKQWREELERRFRQQEIVIRATTVEKL